jgi:predicted DsbA family dithiol-disulfide isomerase
VKNKKFLDDLVNGVYGWQVQDDLKEGLNRGVKDLPAFFINDVPFTGKPTFANLSAAIQSALKKTKSKSTVKKAPARSAVKAVSSKGVTKQKQRA